MSVELLHHVRLIDPTSGTDRIVDVLLNDGNVRSIEPHIMPPPEATVVEGQGKILGPGLVDLHSTVGEPGHEERETLESIAQAAAAGGFMQLNLCRVVDRRSRVGQKVKLHKSPCRCGLRDRL